MSSSLSNNANRKELIEEMITILKYHGAVDITYRDLEKEGWSEPALDGRVVWAMEYRINNTNGPKSIQRIDWIFVDYEMREMSEPDVDWYIQQIKISLGEIDKLVLTSPNLTNSIREIISHNTNEIEIKLHAIIRKLRNEK